MLRISCAVLVALALFGVVNALLRRDRTLGRIIAAGALLRLVGGVSLFVISYYHLPLASSLQRANGLWFFADDGGVYLVNAATLANGGLDNIAATSPSVASVSYLQLLALFMYFMGGSALISVLLNLSAYLAACVVIVWWSRQFAETRRGAILALVALAASPSAILWSTSPLKDPLFAMMVVLFIGTAAAWVLVWMERRPPRLALTACLSFFSIALFAVGGMRWYFAFAMFMTLGVFLLQASVSTARPWVALPVSLLTLLLASRVLMLGAPEMPIEVRELLWPFNRNVTDLSSGILAKLSSARSGFVASGGSTSTVRPPVRPPVPADGASGDRRSRFGRPPRPREKRLRPGDPELEARRIAQNREAARASLSGLLSPEPWVTGAAAMFVPTTVQGLLGVAVVSGGRGLLALSDLDTLFFDMVVVGAFAMTITRRASFRSSVFVLALLLTLMIGLPMIYTVTNFGTLFRLRGMVLVTAALLPLAAASRRERAHTDPARFTTL